VHAVKENTSSTACELAMFCPYVAVTRLQATLANTFLLILQNNALADLGRVVVDFRVHLVVVNFCLQQ